MTVKPVWPHIKGRSEVKIARNNGCCFDIFMFFVTINISCN